MEPDEREKLEDIHQHVTKARIRLEAMDERTQRIDEKTDRLESRVFGPDGLDNQVQKNTDSISRIQGVGAAVAATIGAVMAKFMEII